MSFRSAFRAEALAEAVQLATHAAVVNRGTDARHYAADERIIDLVAGANAFAGEPLQLKTEHLPLGLGEFARARYFGAGETQAFIGHGLETVNDIGQRRNPAMVDQHEEKIARNAREL